MNRQFITRARFAREHAVALERAIRCALEREPATAEEGFIVGQLISAAEVAARSLRQTADLLESGPRRHREVA